MLETGASFRVPLLLSALFLLVLQAGGVAQENQSPSRDGQAVFQSKQFQRWYWLYQRRATEGERILPDTL